MRESFVKSRLVSNAPRIVLILFAMTLTTSATKADIDVFLDYTNFQARLDDATGDAGVADFSAAEATTIRTNILNNITAIFSGYNITFSESNPGGTFETINFGLTAGSGSFGQADQIDFRNLTKTDVARVFTGNFGSFIESGDSRAQQILEFSTALSGTAGHELGHNLGLQHHDSYGRTPFTASNTNGGGPSGGLQNTHVMATGSTGLSETQRETNRTLSDLSHAKLEFADAVVDNPIASVLEQIGPHGTSGTAQEIIFTDFEEGLTDYGSGANVIGALAAASEEDWYKFSINSGEKIAINVFSQSLARLGSGDIDPFLELYDEDGTSLISSNDDTRYDVNSINILTDATRSLDSLILNHEFSSDGTYFLKLRAFNSGDTGNYELFFASTGTAVPEPGSFGALALIGAIAGVVGWRRRRRTK